MPDTNIRVVAQDLASSVFDAVKGKLHELGTEGHEFGDKVKEHLEDPLESAKNVAKGLIEDALGPLGKGLIVAATAATAIGLELIHLGDQAEEAAAKIMKMAMASNASVAGLSDLSFAMKASGGDADGLQRMMLMVQQRMENSPDKFEKGLKMIGLNMADVKDLSMDQVVLKIAQGFHDAGEETNKAAAAMDLMGRMGMNQLPTLVGPLAELAAKHKELGSLTEEDARQAHEFEIAVATSKEQVTETWNAIGRQVAPMTNLVVEGFNRMKVAVANVAYDIVQLVTGFGWISAAVDTFTGTDIPKVNESLKGLADGSGLAAKQLHDQKEKTKELALAAPSLNDALALEASTAGYLTEQVEKAIKAKDEWAKLMVQLTGIGDSWQHTLDQMNGTTVEAIKFYIQAGVSQSVLEKAYEVTKAQIKAVEETLKAEQTALKQTQKVHEEVVKVESKVNSELHVQHMGQIDESYKAVLHSITEQEKLNKEYYDSVMKESLDATDYQIFKIQEWFDDEVDKIKESGKLWQDHYDALRRVAEQRMREVYLAHDKMYQDTKKLLDDLGGAWIDHFSDVLVHTGSFKDAFGTVFKTLKQETLSIFADLLSNIIHSFLDELLHEVESYVAKMLVKLAVLAVFKIFGFGFSGGGVAGGGDGGGEVDYGDGFKVGGMVYAAQGLNVPGPRGTDTVPAWLTPGEGILTTDTVQRIGGPNTVNALNRGATLPGMSGPDLSPILREMKRQGDILHTLIRTLPIHLAHANRGAY